MTFSTSCLLLSEIFPPKTGGSGRWFWEIYRRLPRERYLIAAGEDARQAAFDATHDLRVVRMPLTLRQWGIRSWLGVSGYAGVIRRLKRVVLAEHSTMIHCGRVLPEGVVSLALRWWLGLPYLCYVHGEDVTTAKDSREYTFLVRHVLRGARLLIANSNNTARILREEWGLAPERIRVLHPGVDTERFVPASRDLATRRELAWGERPVVLTVGRLQKRKGHDYMIRALTEIRRAIPDVLYSIIGDGEERIELERIVREEGLEGHVQFLGETDDRRLIACYQQCDLFILPNRQVGKDIEGFGMVLLEAQACGRPAVGGASGGTSETMNAPATGRIIPCESPELIASAVADLLSDRQRLDDMGRAARQWTIDHFDWDSLAKQAQLTFEAALPTKS